MERTELFQKIAQGEFGRLYLFFGEESYVAEKALKQLQEKFLGDVEEGVNLIVFDGAECTAQEVAEQCETVSFFAQEKMIVVLDSPWLGAKEDSAAGDRLDELFREIGQDVVLVFWNKTEVKKKSKLYSLLKKYGEIVEFTKITGSELQAWMRRELGERRGRTVAPPEQQRDRQGAQHLARQWRETPVPPEPVRAEL